MYDDQTNGALLWQHLFWSFGHPEVYIVAVPFVAIVIEIIPVFTGAGGVRLAVPRVRADRG